MLCSKLQTSALKFNSSSAQIFEMRSHCKVTHALKAVHRFTVKQWTLQTLDDRHAGAVVEVALT